MPIFKNNRGQSLIEYLLLVAIMGVASIGVIRVLNHTVKAKFAQVTRALNGDERKVQTEQVTTDLYKKSNLGDFFEKAGDQ